MPHADFALLITSLPTLQLIGHPAFDYAAIDRVMDLVMTNLRGSKGKESPSLRPGGCKRKKLDFRGQRLRPENSRK